MNSAAKDKLSWLFWGPTAGIDLSKRVVILVFTAVSIAALSFCQLAFFPIGEVGGDQVYVVLTKAPLLMGAILFGPLTAALLGLWSGAVLYAHANLLPLDYYEFYYLTNPINTFVLFTTLGVIAGCAFSFIAKRKLRHGAKALLVCIVCLFLSFAMSSVLVAVVVKTYGGVEALVETRYLPCAFSNSITRPIRPSASSLLMPALMKSADGYDADALSKSCWFVRVQVVFSLGRCGWQVA